LELNETFGLCIINFWLEGEERVLNKGVKVWLARDKEHRVSGFLHKPYFDEENFDEECWTYADKNGYTFCPEIEFDEDVKFPSLTFENSPVKARKYWRTEYAHD
jgi:hypothetical protein